MHRSGVFRLVVLGLVVGAGALAASGCRILHVRDPAATLAYSTRDESRGARVGIGYQLEEIRNLVGVGATAHVGYESVDRTAIGWAEAHASFAFVTGMAGFFVDGDGPGPSYGISLGWLLPTCELPEIPESAQGMFGSSTGDCEQRRRFVPRLFYMVDVASGDEPDRHVMGLEVAAGWW